MEANLNTTKDFVERAKQWCNRLQFGTKSQVEFLEDFYLLVNDGIPPNRAIDMMTHVTRGVNRNVAVSLAAKISEGQPLAEGMRDWFNVNIVEIIRVGEEGGALNETIKSAINTLTQRGSVLGSFIGAITYPLFVMFIACVIIVYLDNSIFEQFRAIKPENQWPDAGRQLVSVAQLIESWWWVVLAMIIVTIILLKRLFINYIGEFRPILDKIFPFNIYRQLMASRFMETLGLLVANGIVFKQALKVMQYQASPYLVSHLVVMEHLLGMGRGNIADVLQTGLISENDILRLRVMAEVKGFEHGLIRMGVRGAEESARTMRLIAKIMGGLLMVLGAALIILIIRGIYLTGMSMGST
jgi:type II secretory pathway component PulF